MTRRKIILIAAGVALGIFILAGLFFMRRGAAFSSTQTTQDYAAIMAARLPEMLAELAEERFPLPPETTLLSRAPEIPEGRKSKVFYLAPFYGNDEQDTFTASRFENLMKSYMRAAEPLNLVPWDFVREPYMREDGSGAARVRKPEEYLRDARALDADVFAYGRLTETSGALSAQLGFMDLRTSRTDSWSLSVLPSDFQKLLGGAIQACGRFSGMADARIEETGMLKGLPNSATWDWFRKLRQEPDENALRAAIAADPECIALHEEAILTTGNLTLANEALKKWPDDPRLLLAKARALRWNYTGDTAYLFVSELVRRYPENMLICHELPGALEACFMKYTADAKKEPDEYRAGIETLRALSRHFEKNWCMRWEYASACRSFAHYLRGSRTADQVPESTWKRFNELTAEAQKEIDAAVAQRGDCPDLLAAALRIHFSNGHSDIAWQRSMIERIHAADPSNTDAEIEAAYSHSIGWSEDQLNISILQEAALYHSADARAQAMLSGAISKDIQRRIAFKDAELKQLYKPNPEGDLLIQCAEAAIAGGQKIGDYIEDFLYRSYEARGQVDKMLAQTDSGRYWLLNYMSASNAMKRKEYGNALIHARLGIKVAHNQKRRVQLRYWIVRCLWLQGQYDEALAEAEAGLKEYPREETFDYLFAAVALEKGDRLEEALVHAKSAVDSGTTDPRVKETYDALRKRLGKNG